MSKNSHAKHEHQKVHSTHNSPGYEKPHEDYQAGAFGDVIIGLLIFGLALVFILPFATVLSDSALLIVFGIYFIAILAFIIFVVKKNKRKIAN
ncbi:hypothetical protein EXS66_01540 [Candidatus Saccharibacteria bacterium]|nr:hypothetical protein [Candidatus Saccharibacteria bacterium]